MNNPGIFTRWLSAKKRNLIRIEELEAILDLIPQPVLFVDGSTFRIILANALATELTAYMRSELVGMELDSVLSSDDPDTSIWEALRYSPAYLPGQEFRILTRSGSKISVLTSSTTFAGSNWMLITLEAEKERLRKLNEEQKYKQQWQHLERLAQALQSNDLEIALPTILSIACHVTEAETAAIYQADGENLELVRIAYQGSDTFFPERTSSQDLIHITSNQLWLRRNHPTTRLQSLARQAGYAYLACALMGQPNARVGMVVLAGKAPPTSALTEALPSIASFVTAAFDIINNIRVLQFQMGEQKSSIAIANKLKDLLEDNIILIDRDLKILDINRSVEKSLGYTVREAIGQPIEKILISSEHLEILYRYALSGQDISVIEDLILLRRNGEAFSAHLRVVPFGIENENRGVAVLFQDLSEREEIRRENEILEQRAVLGEVTASFAHEVRNPINNISTGLQLMEINLPPDDPNQENIRRLQQDCNRLTALIKSGLSFIRPIEYKMEPVDAGELLKNLIVSWKSRLERAKISDQLQIESDLPPVEGDLRALEQIFTNLINNAFEAMTLNPANREKILGIKVRRMPTTNGLMQLQFSISDTGVGIPDEIRERIFEPFFTTKTGGTGIGLAIVKRIITAHKGSISVDSIPGGTVFHVQLPTYREKTQPLPEIA